MILKSNKQYVLTNASSTITLKLASDVGVYYFSGTCTLGSNINVNTSGTAIEGMACLVIFNTALTLSGRTVTVLGQLIPDSLSIVGFYAICVWENAAWHVLYAKNTSAGTGGGIGVDANGDLKVNAGTITNAMVDAAAGIVFSKLAALTVSRMLVSDGSGVIIPADTATLPSLTELAYVKGLTSALQTQLTARPASGAIVNADINAAAQIAYSKLVLTGAILATDLAGSVTYAKLILTNSIVNADIYASAAIALTKLAAMTASMIPVTDASGFLISSGVPAAKAAYLTNVSSDLQTQINLVNKHVTTIGAAPLTTNTVLVVGDMTDIIFCDSTAGIFDVTLPLISTLVDGTTVTLHQYSANAVTLKVNAGDTGFITSVMASAATQVIGGDGKWIILRCSTTPKTWTVLSNG